MVKAYLRYELAGTFGVVNSDANVVCDGHYIVSAALENVIIWNAKLGTQHKVLQVPLNPAVSTDGVPRVTALALDAHSKRIAAGHADGTIRIWDMNSGDALATLRGHKGAVTVLCYARQGAMLVSGSQDTTVVVWDPVAEAPLFSLKGHKDQAVVPDSQVLLTASKDGHLRVWSLVTQHCTQIATDARGGVWSLCLHPTIPVVVVGSADQELRVYALQVPEDGAASATTLLLKGLVRRAAPQRVLCCGFAAARDGATVLYAASVGKLVEFFRVRTPDAMAKHIKRQRKRKREGAADATAAPPTTDAAEGKDASETWEATNLLAPLHTLHTKAKLRWAAPLQGPTRGSGDTLLQLVVAKANNSLEVWDVGPSSGAPSHSIDLPGHRSDVRTAVLSPDATLLLTASNDAIKLWNPHTGACLRTAASGYGLCALFVPGGRHVALGTKEGALELFEVASGTMTGCVEGAHQGAVWSMAALPDGSGFVSGGADRRVVVWEWSVDGGGAVTAQAGRTLELTDDVLCVRVSSDGKLLVAALLDATVRVYYLDSFKFFLSLYGHKLPVLAMDISSDGSLLVTGSADKNIRIWGLEFGDCHKSMFAHGDSVMGIAFAPGTHYVFSVGKDRMVKYWDVDKFALLLELPGHAGEVWALAVAPDASFVITAGHDRSIRRWERTEEPFFVEEEREKRLESLFEADPNDARPSLAELQAEAVGEEGQSAAVAVRGPEAAGAADALLEALDMADHETQRFQEHADAVIAAATVTATAPAPNPLLLGLTPSDYVLRAVRAVKPSDMEATLLMLPFHDALALLQHVVQWLQSARAVELSVRVACLLLRLHMGRLMAAPSARPTLVALRQGMRSALQELKGTLGFNLAGVQVLQRMIAESKGVVGVAAPLRKKVAVQDE